MVHVLPALRAFTLLSLIGLGLARAQPVASGDVVLTVTGTAVRANAVPRATFDMKMLEALPQHSITTKLPWFNEPARFTGPLLRDVLKAAGVSGTTIVATAVNDFRTDIPYSDLTRYDVIAARLMNGKPMSVRDKGPLAIVYPFDAHPELKAERYYGRAAWQLILLQVQ